MKKLLFVLAAMIPMDAMAASCTDYPKSDGMDPEALLAGKYIATASAPVNFDDVGAIDDARAEATLKAKALISEFFTDEVTKNEVVNRATEESARIQGNAKQAQRQQLMEKVTKLSSSSAALLRGAVPIGDCYTKGEIYRVSVGIKPETVQAAEQMAATIGTSVSNVPTPTATQPGGVPQRQQQGGSGKVQTSPSQPLANRDGFSNAEGLNKF
jgi:hypothetical protein